MKCKQIRSLVYDYEDGAVDEAMHSAIEGHLSGCSACKVHYENQQRLHRSMAVAVSSELAGLHFMPAPIKEEPSSESRPSMNIWVRCIAFAASCLIVLCAATWVIWKPVPKPTDDLAPSAYAEAYHYLDMCRTDSPGASSFATPLAVIIQPGVPARIVELNGTTDVSDALK
jgi:predicted anti-sigma-YlaC factor YlaD